MTCHLGDRGRSRDRADGSRIASTESVGHFWFSRALGRERNRVSFLLRMGPQTLAAYLKLAKLIVAERLWRVPPRRARGDQPVGDRQPGG